MSFYNGYAPIFWRGGRLTERPAQPTSRQQAWWSWDTEQAFFVGSTMQWRELSAGSQTQPTEITDTHTIPAATQVVWVGHIHVTGHLRVEGRVKIL